MLHGFFSIDKSPLLNLSKKGLTKASLLVAVTLATASISTGFIPVKVAGFSNTQTASAGVDIGANDIVSAWWSRFGAGRFQQTYFGNISPSYSTYIKNNWGSSASARAHAICTNYAEQVTRISMWESSWFFVAVQYNGDRFNCYYRKPIR